MGEQKRVFKWWWGWNPGKIETWLEEEEAKGWNLVAINTPGVRFTFEKGSPRKVAYCIDYQSQVKADYHQLLTDAGWSQVNSGVGWYYWQQVYTTHKPALFTDLESLIDRNRRQMWLFGLLTMVQFPGLMNILRFTSHNPRPLYKIAIYFQGSVFFLMLTFLFIFLSANRKLKKQAGERHG